MGSLLQSYYVCNIFLLMKMVRAKQIKDAAKANSCSIYMSPVDWEDLSTIASSRGITRSELIRDIIAPTLEDFRGGRLPDSMVNIKAAQEELLRLKGKERNLRALLSGSDMADRLGRKNLSDYEVMCEFICRRFDVSPDLDVGVEDAIKKLWLVSLTDDVPFTSDVRAIFCHYLETLVLRRKKTREIEEYHQKLILSQTRLEPEVTA